MKDVIRLLATGIAAALTGCGKPSTSKTGMPRHEVEAKLFSITGLKIPASATGVHASEASAFTHLFDCNFECPLLDLKEAWRDAPPAMEGHPIDRLILPPRGTAAVFDGPWPAREGMLSVEINLHDVEAGRVRVEIRTTHEVD